MGTRGVKEKELFGLPVRVDESVQPGTVFLMPSEITAGIDIAESAEAMNRHGIIPRETVDRLWKDVTDAAVKAAREGRIGCIKNLT